MGKKPPNLTYRAKRLVHAVRSVPMYSVNDGACIFCRPPKGIRHMPTCWAFRILPLADSLARSIYAARRAKPARKGKKAK